MAPGGEEVLRPKDCTAWIGSSRRRSKRALPHINNNEDFADVLSEMLGELNASHTGAGYRIGEPTVMPRPRLGLFYTDDTKAGTDHRGGDRRKGLGERRSKIKAGEVIEKIDGVDITATEDPADC